MFQELANAVRWFGVVLAAIVAASNTDSDSSAVDIQNCDGVLFVTPIVDSVATGVATLTVEVADAVGGPWTEVPSAAAEATCAVNDDLNGKVLVVDVYRPLGRYVRANITSVTANIAFGATQAIGYHTRTQPVAQDNVAALVSVAG